MSVTPQDLMALGINPFAVTLLCESILKSPIAAVSADAEKPLTFFTPVSRGDCPGWMGVEIAFRAVRSDAALATSEPPQR